MSAATGADAAILLLRLLPDEVAGRVLACLGPDAAQRVRAMLAAAGPLTPEAERQALQAFFDMQRIADRPMASPSPPSPPPPAEPPSESSSPPDELNQIEPALLARALEGELPSTIALVLGRLEPASAAEVLRRIPAAVRAEIAARLSRPRPDYVLTERLTRAVVEKARRLAERPPEPSPEDRARGLAAMLRRLARPDRAEMLTAIERTDPNVAAQIRGEMFSFDDLLLVEDRQLQLLLTALDLKTLATALKGAPDALAEKILRNCPSRTRQALNDEIALLASVPKSAVREAQDKVVAALRQFEEEGKITFES